ncbi:hypothetical protein [Methanoculleus sp. 7T]|uniref:hypothetical protein n=1 Tax=Methanoculleus sp. 7T TaxID=2937282 RepID=UPI0020BF94B7|nr:hypothetical protein [Methanoculleus sp. 7T]MCK8519648.1 hypothetical protein [Methanoculleus sp. 7T]
MDVVGRVTCERVIGGLWFSCTLEQDQFAGGEKVLTWKSHWVAGWDFAAQEYRAAGFDSNGVSAVFLGEIEGDRLVMESVGPEPMKLRFVWDASDPGRITWRNEISPGEGVWNLIEEFVFTPEE